MTSGRKDCACRCAAPLVRNCFRVPINFERRFPFFHHRKFQVLRLVSNTTLPVLCRAALFIDPSFRQGARMAIGMVARGTPEVPRPSHCAETARHDALCPIVQTLSPCPGAPKATAFGP